MVVIKVTFLESVRRISIPNAVEGYAALKKCIQQEIGGAAHRINYTDEDGDHVTIGSYDEFSLAIDENIKHFKVTFTAVTTTKVSSGGKSSQSSTCLSANSSLSNDADEEEAASEEPGEEPGDEHWEEIENESEKRDFEPPKKKNPKYELKRKTLQKICDDLGIQHKSNFGITCAFSVEVDENNHIALIMCPFCNLKLQVKKLLECQVKQAVTVHMNRKCHKSNIYAVTERDSLKSEELAEIELAEAKAVHLLKSIDSTKEFTIVTNDGKSYARCLTCGPLSKDIALLPKGTDFQTSIRNHLESKTHQSAKKQGTIPSCFFSKKPQEKAKCTQK